MRRILKDYWLSISVLLFFAIILTCGIKEPILKQSTKTNDYSIAHLGKLSDNIDGIKEKGNCKIDIPTLLTQIPEQILYRKSYIVSYNKETKIPNWVAWRLTADHTSGNCGRLGNAFHEDFDVPAPRANNDDYKDSGWSRGHLCPAGDNKWDSEAMYESFLLSNVCPQNKNLNSGVWNQIEISCRKWAEIYGDIYIVSGPILFNQEHETIGKTQIVVPEAFFKVVLCLTGEPKGIGFICRNTDSNRRKDFYVNSISQIEQITKIKFFPNLDPDVAANVKAQEDLSTW